MKKFYVFLTIAFVYCLTGISYGQAVLLDDNHSQGGFPFNGRIFLASDRDSSLWTSDGTPDGTTRFSINIKPDNAGLTQLGNLLYFAGITAATGTELWSTDGTATGTALVADIWAGPDSSKPDDFIHLTTRFTLLPSPLPLAGSFMNTPEPEYLPD